MPKRPRFGPRLAEISPYARVSALDAALRGYREISDASRALQATSDGARWLPERLDADPALVEMLAQPAVRYFAKPKRLTVHMICTALHEARVRKYDCAFRHTLEFHVAFTPAAELTSATTKLLLDSLELLLVSGPVAVAFARRYASASEFAAALHHMNAPRTVGEKPPNDAAREWLRAALTTPKASIRHQRLGYELGITPAFVRRPASPYGDDFGYMLRLIVERDDVALVDAFVAWLGDARVGYTEQFMCLAHVSDAMIARVVPLLDTAVVFNVPALLAAARRVPAVLERYNAALAAAVADDDVAFAALVAADAVPPLFDSDLDLMRRTRIVPGDFFARVALRVDGVLPPTADVYALAYASAVATSWSPDHARGWPETERFVRASKGAPSEPVDATTSAAFFACAPRALLGRVYDSHAYEFMLAHRSFLRDAAKPFASTRRGSEHEKRWQMFLTSRVFAADEWLALALYEAELGLRNSYVAHSYAVLENGATLRRTLAAHVRERPAFVLALRALAPDDVHNTLIERFVRSAFDSTPLDVAVRAKFVNLVTAEFT